jgi:hypothetical protein
MARKPDGLAFVLGTVLAMAMTVLAITTWARVPDLQNESAAPLPPRETIYRPQNWIVY